MRLQLLIPLIDSKPLLLRIRFPYANSFQLVFLSRDFVIELHNLFVEVIDLLELGGLRGLQIDWTQRPANCGRIVLTKVKRGIVFKLESRIGHGDQFIREGIDSRCPVLTELGDLVMTFGEWSSEVGRIADGEHRLAESLVSLVKPDDLVGLLADSGLKQFVRLAEFLNLLLRARQHLQPLLFFFALLDLIIIDVYNLALHFIIL